MNDLSYASPAVRTPVDSAAIAARRARNDWADVLRLFALTSLAVAQPIYDRLGKQVEFLVDPNVTPLAILNLVLILSVGIPLAFVALESLARLWSRPARDFVHLSLVALLLFVLLMPFICRIEFLAGWAMALLALAGAAGGASCYVELPRFRLAILLCLPGVAIFPAVLLSNIVWANLPAQLSLSEPKRRVPVVVVVFDEFCGSSLMTPEREIDADRFPNFAALAKEATWFRNASSASSATITALPAILSGKYPLDEPAIPQNIPQNLFTVLTTGAGYEMTVFEPISCLAPRSLERTGRQDMTLWTQTERVLHAVCCVFLFDLTPIEYRDRLPKIPYTWFGWNSRGLFDRERRRGTFRYGWEDRRDDQFHHFLACIDSDGDSLLWFGHFLAPHTPWSYLPSGNYYAPDCHSLDPLCLEFNGHVILDELGAAQNQQRHLLQVMYVDRLIGELLDRLTQIGLRDRCLLIVTADHGVSFRVGEDRRAPNKGNADDILSIPLFIKRPGQQAGETIDRMVSTIDILPTIADVLGIRLTRSVEGWSAFDESHPQRDVLRMKPPNFRIREFDPQVIPNSVTPAKIRERFGPGSQPDRLYRIGPLPELIGRRVDSLPLSDSVRPKIRFLQYGDEAGHESPAFIPCFFEGSIHPESPTTEPLILAAAVNGVIHATTRTYLQAACTDRWSVFVPEAAFRPGKNDVRFYLVAAEDHRLTPCDVGRLPEPALPDGL